MGRAIQVKDLGKRFRYYHANRPTTLQEAVVNGLRRLKHTEYFWALRNISFSVPQGRMLGVIGPNGAGKSTLMRLVGGVGRPDEGTIKVKGRIGGLLELGAGFHPDLTGRENVFINGIIFGLIRSEVEQRFDEIVAFAELEAAIDNPLRTYSTGMRMRLGFAIAAHTSPEILLIDEVLAVGDASFRSKCLERINQFKQEGCTIMFVSHNADQVREHCDEVVWLHKGQMVAYGDPAEIVDNYLSKMNAVKA